MIAAAPARPPCYDTAVTAPISLYGLSRTELETLVTGLGEPRYRSDQIWHWLYRQLCTDIDEMRNLPLGFRDRLRQLVRLHTLAETASTVSRDGAATKTLFRLADGRFVETVLMHYVDPADSPDGERDSRDGAGRHTVCLSTQAGCAMGCVFCATGQMGLERDLTAGECVEQVVHSARSLAREGSRLSNVVFMGMGEPLANWKATWATVETLVDRDGLAMGSRRLTISTVGVVPGIRRLAEARHTVRLAVSLHAPNDSLRSRLVPLNDVYPLDELMPACRYYQRRRGRRITFEYVLIDGVNDSDALARDLVRLLRGLTAHVNLIPLNPTEGSSMRPSSYDRLVAFEGVLERGGVPVTARVRRGVEIDAGCGQLRTRVAPGQVGRTLAARGREVA